MSLSKIVFKASNWQKLNFSIDCSSPSGRVGHTAHALYSGDGVTFVLLLCGADFVNTYTEAYLLEVISNTWTKVEINPFADFSGLRRYEHSSAITTEKQLILFGGATKSGPLNQLNRFQLHHTNAKMMQLTRDTILETAEPFPYEARTQHCCACLTEYDQLLVFSGGQFGHRSVTDHNVHLYDVMNDSWEIVPYKGEAPSPRLGHLMIYEYPKFASAPNSERAPKGKLFIHGGMSEGKLYDDLYILDFYQRSPIWIKLYPYTEAFQDNLTVSSSPSARAAHGGVIIPQNSNATLVNTLHNSGAVSSKLFIFGGLSVHGAMNDLFCYDTGSHQWTEIHYEDPSLVPAPRLDFAYCLLKHKLIQTDRQSCTKQITPNDGFQISFGYYLFIHGGMITDGQILDDSYVLLLACEETLNEDTPCTEEVGNKMLLS